MLILASSGHLNPKPQTLNLVLFFYSRKMVLCMSSQLQVKVEGCRWCFINLPYYYWFYSDISFVVIGQVHSALMFQPAIKASHKFVSASSCSSIATFPLELFWNKDCSVRYSAILLTSSVSDWSPHPQPTQKYILPFGFYKKLSLMCSPGSA